MQIFGFDLALGAEGVEQTVAFTAEDGYIYMVDTATTGAVTVSCPDPQAGARFGVVDSVGNAAIANITVDTSGDLYHGAAADDVFAVANEVGIYLFVNATIGWIRVNGIGDN